MADNKFESTIEWDKAMKLCKAYKTKNGAVMGNFTTHSKIVISKNTASWAKEGEYQVQIVPVKFEKPKDGGDLPNPVQKKEDDWG